MGRRPGARYEATRMASLRALLTLILMVFLTFPVVAQESYELSFLLVRSTDGQVLAEQQADKLRIPASTLKAVTAAVALETLGPKHRFSTVLLADSAPRRGQLKGDLYLKGEADPELTRESLTQLVEQLRSQGLRTVEGDLVVDPGPYSFPHYGTGWAWDDAGQYYSPEITGVSVDGGLVEIDPELEPQWLQRVEGESRATLLIPGREGVLVRGKLPSYLAPPRTAVRCGELLKELLSQNGIVVKGEVREGTAKGKVLVNHSSRELSDILKKALAVSDNLAMELLWRASDKRLPQALTEAKLRVVDGSGLSRYNLISARQLVALLSQTDLREYLPSPGEGTLKKRFLDGWAAHNLVAKTGTMSNVSALTGYLFPNTDKECVFAILINGHLESTKKRKAIENEMVEKWAREVGWPYVLEQ